MEIFKYIGYLIFLYYFFTNKYFWYTVGYVWAIIKTTLLVIGNVLIYLMERGQNEKS